ncbi:DUF262 domain-containing protein [Nannocystis sp. ILAH1]|uniref:DUF262 domain-containing protein n=1 Tax=Nannocystis sp. ILAH1 TaxID=2996789 RepID=UPI00226DB0DF|nr:DUF262 domain-containing protein [Nannocystis sp. ILAH1]MCY0990515.1 DUF262 domain-containing protein [Nannocystis sp. ILAH1]
MARIYDEKSEELYKLLDKAAQSTGATLVIPDLQRPYVWTPNQVTLLVDSLIRGWPFGTLLLWRVQHDEKRNIPSRAFWQVVDRTGDEEGTSLMEQQPPAEYQMVLDGQQRIQSLLLATHGDNWGFRLKDRDWSVEVGTRSLKGGSTTAHWSQGCLCLDLEKFLSGYAEAKQQLNAVEFEKALVWAVTDEQGGRSKTRRSKAYKEPIPYRFIAENSSRLIRFSRLWQLAGINAGLKEKNYHEPIRAMLAQHGVTSSIQDESVAPLAELMTTLRDVKLHKVAFLELSAFDAGISDRETYDDAIVNIFTRLNTAGRTLTREEITFAWLKVGWNAEDTEGESAHHCFKSLQEDLRLKEQTGEEKLEIDEVVAAVSFIWSVAFHGGSLLTSRDLLKGDIIRPMAGDLSNAWTQVRAAIIEVAAGVNERKLERGKHYTSFNALLVLAAARFQVLQRAAGMTLKVTERDHLEKSLEKLLQEFTDRWLICSTWAGRWARASGQILAGYAAQLAKDDEYYEAATSVADLLAVHRDRLETLVRDLEADALSYIDNRLGVDSREQVRQYFTALWLWHRLDAKRWDASKTPLRVGRARSDSLDVDHIVSVKLWEGHKAAKDMSDDAAEIEQIINSIGNCVLLQKSFNIAKSARPLAEFMAEVHEFKEGKPLEEWANALSLTATHMNGKTADTATLIQATKDRENSIRTELMRFIKGECRRVDS